MSDSKLEVYLHFVWATKRREPTLTPEVERDVHRIIWAEAKRLRCETLAVNGMPDHVHLLVRLGRGVSVGRLMNQVKGVSSRFLNEKLYPNAEGFFRCQPGYGAFSVGPNQVKAVLNYVHHQKQHHAEDDIRPAWEEVPESDDEQE